MKTKVKLQLRTDLPTSQVGTVLNAMYDII